MWSRCAASERAASALSSGSGTGSSASGIPSAVFAITSASLSSVFASPANSLDASWAASPGRYATSSPAALALLMASDPMLRAWSTTARVPASALENSLSRSLSELATGPLATTSPSAVTRHAQ